MSDTAGQCNLCFHLKMVERTEADVRIGYSQL